MAASLLIGGAVGAGMQEVLGRAIEMVEKGMNFNSELKSSTETLDTLIPLVEQMKQLARESDRSSEVITNLENEIQKGKELTEKCSKFRWWRFLSFPVYHDRIQERDKKIGRHLSMGVQAQIATDSMETLKNVRKILEILGDEYGGGGMGRRFVLRGVSGVPEMPEFTVGLDEPLRKLKVEVLKKGGDRVLLVTGLGGSGKSTLAKKLCWDVEVKAMFAENIFFLTVSKTPNLKAIVQTLFEHCEGWAPEFQTDEDAFNRLGNLLRRVRDNSRPILLVLDDVWSDVIVEKFKFPSIQDYKIVVTSRFAFPRFPTQFQLKPLKNDDAFSLFHHFTQAKDNTNSYKPHENLVQEIVRGCNGSPLALEVIGGSLCQHPFEFWQTMKERIKSNKDLLSHLQNCLDILEDNKEKECFMDLGLFPEDQRIRVPILIDMWTELHELDEDGQKAMNIIHSLNTKNLANVIVKRKVATDVEMYYNNHFLMQHDLLRELANHQSDQEPIEQRKRLAIDLTQSGKNCPNWLIGQNQPGILSRMLSFLSLRGTQQQQEQKQVSPRIMFISTDETFTANWYDMNPDETEVLILNIHSSKYTFPDIIKKMSKLKVLIVTNQGFHPCELNKFELLGSLPCLKRIRLEKVSVPRLCRLRNLRNLSLYMCTTKHAFGSSDIKVSDALPYLEELNIDYCKDLVEFPSDFCNITTMKKLSITNCHNLCKLPQEIVMLQNLEVLRLSSCSHLEEMPESVGRLEQIWCLDISDCTSLTQLPADIGELPSLLKIYMWGCSGLNELPHSVTYFQDLKHVIHVICDDEGAALWEHFTHFVSLPNLKIVKVRADINLRWLRGFQ